MSGVNKSVSKELRKQFYYKKRSVYCQICHVHHNLSHFASKFVLSPEQLYEYQKFFDPDVKNEIIKKGAICDKKYKCFMASKQNLKRKREAEVS